MSQIQRQWYFINYMFPLQVYGVGGAIAFCTIYLTVQAIVGQGQIIVTANLVLGMVLNILLLFLLRLYDEIKDVDNDVTLGKAGDPRYKDRPIVTGKITLADIRALRWYVTATLIVLVLFTGPIAFLAFAWLFFYMWLSFKWFFYPDMKNNLIMAFITHNPIVLFLAVFLMTLGLIDQNSTQVPGLVWLFMFSNWFPIAAWEISRKIRLPGDETKYQTYSKILGWKTAVLLALAFVIGTSVINIYIFSEVFVEHWKIMALVFVSIALYYTWRCIDLLYSPTPEKAKLQSKTESVIGLINISIIVFIGLNYKFVFAYGGNSL